MRLQAIKLKQNRQLIIDKQNKGLHYNSQCSFVDFKNVDDFKELSLDSMNKGLNGFRKKITRIKKLTP